MSTTVLFGSARSNEHGAARDGTPGDQTGGEVAIQKAYVHEKGWVGLRAKGPAMRPYLAASMKAACNNQHIGYDQPNRLALRGIVEHLGYDPAKVTTETSCDCSSLVWVCIMYALYKLGIKASIPNFRTVSEPEILKATGLFDVITDPEYTKHPERWMEGDILCTPVSGHTGIILNDGDLAHVPIPQPAPAAPFDVQKPPELKYGSTGKAVAFMQSLLVKKGNKMPNSILAGGAYGMDGIWKARLGRLFCETEKVLRAFQKANGLKVDGICGPKTWAALLK